MSRRVKEPLRVVTGFWPRFNPAIVRFVTRNHMAPIAPVVCTQIPALQHRSEPVDTGRYRYLFTLAVAKESLDVEKRDASTSSA
jgi:hypothetical protein